MLLNSLTAWLQLKFQKTRLVIALSGVIFAVLIIFMQLGLRDALFDSSIRFHKSILGDLFIIDPRSSSTTATNTFSERRLLQVQGFKEVEFVSPIYSTFLLWRNPQITTYWRSIYLIGFDLRRPIFKLSGVQKNIDKLKVPDTVLFDLNGRDQYGPIVSMLNQQGKVTIEIRDNSVNRQIQVVGLFDLGTSFGVDGTLITSHLNFMRITSQQNKRLINIGAVKLIQGVNVDQFTQKLKQYLPEDVKVLSRDEFIEWEKTYWRTGTAIGFIFSLGVGLGIIVGIVVVYQILYSNVAEHLPEYATLKAIGYLHRYLLGLVLQQSIIIAILGYIPGFLLSELLYGFTQQATKLPIAMTLERAIQVFIFTLIMCFISGVTAVQKLKEADPADIY